MNGLESLADDAPEDSSEGSAREGSAREVTGATALDSGKVGCKVTGGGAAGGDGTDAASLLLRLRGG